MMLDPIENKVSKWEQDGGKNFREINFQILYLNDRLYFDYEPSLGPEHNFIDRLNKWLENITNEEHQKTLFELVPNIFYVGKEEINVLYREAFNTNFARWIIDSCNIDFFSADPLSDINAAIKETWFCPLTDSLRINQFYHINDVQSKHDFRPDWRSLVEFGDVGKIKAYIAKQGIKRIVLIEDFIGNGGQVSKAIMFAVKELTDIPILVLPLIICPEGVKNSEALQNAHNNIKISPVLILNQDCFINSKCASNTSDFAKDIWALSKATYEQVANSKIIDPDISPYGPLGWRDTGSMVVLHTNTPNNTLPLIHNKSDTWFPLFKRHKRI